MIRADGYVIRDWCVIGFHKALNVVGFPRPRLVLYKTHNKKHIKKHNKKHTMESDDLS